jgi:hypothetical protein
MRIRGGAIIVILALAGCESPPGASDASAVVDGAPADAPPPDAYDGPTITGRVVDRYLAPVAGITVAIPGAGATTTGRG